MIEIKIDPRQLRRIERVLRHVENAVPKVLAPAINRALNKGRTTVRREIRKEYVIKQKDIPVRVIGASETRLSGVVRLDQPMLDLNKFKVQPKGVQHRRRRQPIFVQVRKDGGRVISTGFVAAMPSGYTGPFMRKTAARFPIRKLIAIGSPIMAAQPKVGPEVQKQMDTALDKNIDSQIRRRMAEAGGHS
jgi:Prophage minor tail protein Z (GPZ)